MADIELVIKIPEGLKNDFESEQWTALSCMEMKNALEKATPLPKGHGRLIDADAIYKDIISALGIRDENYLLEAEKAVYKRIKNAPTIIAEDKKYEAKVITRGNCMMCGKELTEGLFFCKECEAKAIQGKRRVRK